VSRCAWSVAMCEIGYTIPCKFHSKSCHTAAAADVDDDCTDGGYNDADGAVVYCE